MKELARSRGGKCVSRRYVSSSTKLRWQCAEGHQWEAPPNTIQQGSWCPRCSYVARGDQKRLNVGDMHALASERGGRCRSQTYSNANTKLLWECAEGHVWEATPDRIQQGKWCPHCAGVAKKTIDDMQRLAETRGGKCLSEQYVSNREPLLWECADGHVWRAVGRDIQQGKRPRGP